MMPRTQHVNCYIASQHPKSLLMVFTGFIIGEPFIPKWVIWLYWLNPVSWTVYGTVASQLSDVTDQTVELVS